MHYIANYRRLQLLLPYDFVLHYILYYITQYITLYYIFSLYGTFSLFLIKLTSTRLADHLVFITLHNIIYMYYNKQHATLQVHYIIIQSKLPKLPPLLSSHLLYAVTLFPPDENSYIIAL